MEDQELLNLWRANDNKLEKLLTINLNHIEFVQKQKVKSAFQPLFLSKIFSLLFGIVCVIFFGTFIFNHLKIIHMIISGGILLALSVLHTAICIAHLNIISDMKYSQSIIDLQEKLASFQSFSAIYARISLLMFPLFIACQIIFFEVVFNVDFVAVANPDYWNANIILSVMFIPPAIWLYKKLTVRNFHIKWVRNIIGNSSGKATANAMEFLREIEDFKREL